MVKIYLLLLTGFVMTTISNAQQTVTFPSSDGLTVTAGLYLQDKSYPFIILFHQANYSRGEYIETAPRLMKLGYNCLAVDLRSGNEVNYVRNETAALAREKNFPVSYAEAEKDMLAAIQYVKQYNNNKIILFGSSYSASLALKIAVNNPGIKAVIAFSPGEYFQPAFTLQDLLTGLDKPVFIGATKKEAPFIKKMLSGIKPAYISWFVPSQSNGVHGSRALWSSSPESSECWMQLLMFFEHVKKNQLGGSANL